MLFQSCHGCLLQQSLLDRPQDVSSVPSELRVMNKETLLGGRIAAQGPILYAAILQGCIRCLACPLNRAPHLKMQGCVRHALVRPDSDKFIGLFGQHPGLQMIALEQQVRGLMRFMAHLCNQRQERCQVHDLEASVRRQTGQHSHSCLRVNHCCRPAVCHQMLLVRCQPCILHFLPR